METFTASGHFRIVQVADSDAEVAAAPDRGHARTASGIPPRFAADVQAGRGPAVQVLIDGTSSNTATVAQGYGNRLLAECGRTGANPLGGEVELRAREDDAHRLSVAHPGDPLRHFLEIIRDLFLKGAGVADLWVQFSALALMAAGGLLLAVQRFRVTLE